jgi:hypothetical protein
VRTTNIIDIQYAEDSVLEEKNMSFSLTQSLLFTNVLVYVTKSRRMILAGHVARRDKGRGAYKILLGRPEGRRPLGKPRRRWDNIKMDFQEVGWGMDWIDMAQDRDRWRVLVLIIFRKETILK